MLGDFILEILFDIISLSVFLYGIYRLVSLLSNEWNIDLFHKINSANLVEISLVLLVLVSFLLTNFLDSSPFSKKKKKTLRAHNLDGSLCLLDVPIESCLTAEIHAINLSTKQFLNFDNSVDVLIQSSILSQKFIDFVATFFVSTQTYAKDVRSQFCGRSIHCADTGYFSISLSALSLLNSIYLVFLLFVITVFLN